MIRCFTYSGYHQIEGEQWHKGIHIPPDSPLERLYASLLKLFSEHPTLSTLHFTCEEGEYKLVRTRT